MDQMSTHDYHGASNHWKPPTLSSPVLFGFVAFSTGGIILLELLAQISSNPVNGGGLVFVEGVGSFSVGTSFLFLYLPIVVAVTYSMLWSWVDLDVKRLEPWFQLSKQNGANAEDSLLLQYPFDFLPFVPFAAFRRKHWGVFFSGTIMLLIFWVITPLQPAIFNTGVVTRAFSTDFIDSAYLLPIESQNTNMHVNILNRAYGITWLNESLPPYTTMEFATLPFLPAVKINNNKLASSEVWRTTANAYRTNLTCKSAQAVATKDGGYTFNNGEGCVSTLGLPDINPAFNNGTNGPIAKYLFMYLGWDSDAHVSDFFGNPNCTQEHSNNYLAIYATAQSRTNASTYSDLQASFCKPSYGIEEIFIAVNASNGAVINAESTGKVLDQPLGEIFNTTLFEYIMGVGINPQVYYLGTGPRKTDWIGTDRMEQYPKAMNLGLKWPLTNMAGFVAGLNAESLQDLGDSKLLHQALEKTHQVLFTSAFSVLTRQISDLKSQKSRSGNREDQTAAIVLVRTLAIVVEVAFGVVSLLAIALWYSSSRRASSMQFDPASIANVMSMTSMDNELSDSMNDDGTVTAGKLDQLLYLKRYRVAKTKGSIPSIEPLKNSWNSTHPSAPSEQGRDTLSRAVRPVRPLEHHLYFGAIFGGVILSASAGLVFIERWGIKNNGISLPSMNPVVRSIIQNYAPTAFATFLEPMWLILSRLLCLLQPFEVLREGAAKASTSLHLKYTAIPPQLAIFRALRARHFLLAIVCFVTVSTNFLAVTLAGLLNEGLAEHAVPYLSTQNLLPIFNATGDIEYANAPVAVRDHFYVALSHYSSNNPLPPWLDSEYFYLPFELRRIDRIQSNFGTEFQTFHGETFGITARTSCSVLTPAVKDANAKDTVTYIPDFSNSSAIFSTSHLQSDGSRSSCAERSNSYFFGEDMKYIREVPPGLGASAWEMVDKLVPLTATVNDTEVGLVQEREFCGKLLVAGWGRVPAASPDGRNRTVESVFIGCQPKIQIARFNVSVDKTGRILASNRTSEFSEDEDEIFMGDGGGALRLFSTVGSSIAAPGGPFGWHNDTFTSDWLNSLLIARSANTSPLKLDPNANFTSVVDPLAPLPNGTAIASAVGELYTLLFAVLLSLHADMALTLSNSSIPVNAEVHVQVTKIFVSEIMYKISLAILLVHFCTAVAYYVFRPKRFLTRMPTSIASVVAYVSCSRALDDFVSGVEDTKLMGENGEEQRYGYGRFIGRDGKTHVGIERMRYVIPLESENPDAKRDGWLSGLRWRGRKGDGREVKTWI